MAKNVEKIAEGLGAQIVGQVSNTGGALGATKVAHEAAAPARQALDVKFREAMESGPATPMTRDDWDELERNVWERHGQAQAAQQP
jgi:hypothetical protein